MRTVVTYLLALRALSICIHVINDGSRGERSGKGGEGGREFLDDFMAISQNGPGGSTDHMPANAMPACPSLSLRLVSAQLACLSLPPLAASCSP